MEGQTMTTRKTTKLPAAQKRQVQTVSAITSDALQVTPTKERQQTAGEIEQCRLPAGFQPNPLVGSKFENHPSVAGRYFFSLPDKLFFYLLKSLGEKAFTPEELELECLAIERTDFSSQVGFLNGQALSYFGLAPFEPCRFDYETAKAIGVTTLTKAAWDFDLKTADDFFKWNQPNRHAYCGWLLSNSTFLSEHDVLLQQWMPLAARIGMNLLGIDFPFERVDSGSLNLNEETWRTCDSAFKSFLQRWRLQSLTAPYLPNLIEVTLSQGEQLPAKFYPRSGTLYLTTPDVAPIPPESLLRPMMERARKQSTDAEHLAEWFKLVSIHTNRKKPFEGLSRRFELMHYWRAFMSRHADKARRNLERIKEAFAGYLEIDPASVNRHVVELKKQLGDDWAPRGQELLALSPRSTKTLDEIEPY
jgi:hypothetical protein